jgi:hypothetical protein
MCTSAVAKSYGLKLKKISWQHVQLYVESSGRRLAARILAHESRADSRARETKLTKDELCMYCQPDFSDGPITIGEHTT